MPASRIGSVVPFKMTNTTISIRTAAAQPNGNVLVTIHCDGKPATLFTRAEIAATLREQSVDGSKIGADIAADKIQIDGPKDCVEGGSIQSRVRKAEVPRQRPNDEVRILQARLCLPYFEANGLWGRNTQRALDAWRVRTGSNATGKPITDEERTTILGAEPTAAAKWCAT